MTHPQFIHENGDVCIWVDDAWFVPLDVGGEGYDCEHGHPTDDALEEARREGAAEVAERVETVLRHNEGSGVFVIRGLVRDALRGGDK